MTSLILFTAGVAVLALVLYDFLRTAISLAGLGPISAPLTRCLWRFGRRLTLAAERQFGLSLRQVIGPAILSALAASWIVLHLGGYALLYLSGRALEVSETGAPANLVETVAFAGAALSTLGASTVQPVNGWWDGLSMIAAINGMVVLTLSVSFVLNILQTTLRARSWAIRYNALCESAEARGETRRPETVASLAPELVDMAVTFTASPLTGVFVPNDHRMSFPAVFADLCEMLERSELADQSSTGAGELAELRAAAGLLGRHVGNPDERNEFAAARAWALRHGLPPRA